MTVKRNVKLKIWERDRKCHYCQVILHEENRTIDHVIPRHSGGTSQQENLVACCFDCNQKKDQRERPIILNKIKL